MKCGAITWAPGYCVICFLYDLLCEEAQEVLK